MVEIEEMQEEKKAELDESPSQQRQLDADELSRVLDTLTRPSAKAHLEPLIAKLRREAAALKRVEASKLQADKQSMDTVDDDDEVFVSESVTPPPAAPVELKTAPPAPQQTPKTASSTPATAPPPSSLQQYVSIDKFAFEMGAYGSQFITLYIDLPQVGTIPKSNVSCQFTSTSFDLIVRGLNNKSYRLLKDNLEHDIDHEKSKYIIKANKVIVKLAKKKQEYGGYEHWTQLTAKKTKKPPGNKEDPSASIMEMMKDLYDSGDDKMKKMIGETMEKQRRGELGKDSPSGMDMDYGM